MRKLLVPVMVSGLLVPTLLMGTSTAHVSRIDTTLSIDRLPSGQVDSGDRVLVFGKLRPKRCADGQTVTLRRVSPGRDKVLGRDRLDGDGEYGIRFRPTDDMKVYTKVGPATIRNNYQHNHRCRGDRSPKIRINVG
jgi:hypothetical protein